MYETWLPAFDWSDYQPSPNFEAAKAHGIVLGVRKACQGARVGGQARFAADREAARRAGFPFGAYSFTEVAQNRNPEAEADALLRSTGDLADCTVAPTWDVEDLPGQSGALERNLGPNGLAEMIVRFNRRIRDATSWQTVAYIGLPTPVAPIPELLELVTWTPNYGSTSDYATIHGIDHRPAWRIPPDQPWSVDQQVMIQPSGGNGRLPPDVMTAGTQCDLDLVNPALLSHITTLGADTMSAADQTAINEHVDDVVRPLYLQVFQLTAAQQAQQAQRFDGRDYWPISLAGDGDYLLVRQLWARTAQYPSLDGSTDGLVFPFALTKIPDGEWYRAFQTAGAFGPSHQVIDPAAAQTADEKADLEAQVARMRSLPVIPWPNLPKTA